MFDNIFDVNVNYLYTFCIFTFCTDNSLKGSIDLDPSYSQVYPSPRFRGKKFRFGFVFTNRSGEFQFTVETDEERKEWVKSISSLLNKYCQDRTRRASQNSHVSLETDEIIQKLNEKKNRLLQIERMEVQAKLDTMKPKDIQNGLKNFIDNVADQDQLKLLSNLFEIAV